MEIAHEPPFFQHKTITINAHSWSRYEELLRSEANNAENFPSFLSIPHVRNFIWTFCASTRLNFFPASHFSLFFSCVSSLIDDYDDPHSILGSFLCTQCFTVFPWWQRPPDLLDTLLMGLRKFAFTTRRPTRRRWTRTARIFGDLWFREAHLVLT